MTGARARAHREAVERRAGHPTRHPGSPECVWGPPTETGAAGERASRRPGARAGLPPFFFFFFFFFFYKKKIDPGDAPGEISTFHGPSFDVSPIFSREPLDLETSGFHRPVVVATPFHVAPSVSLSDARKCVFSFEKRPRSPRKSSTFRPFKKAFHLLSNRVNIEKFRPPESDRFREKAMLISLKTPKIAYFHAPVDPSSG